MRRTTLSGIGAGLLLVAFPLTAAGQQEPEGGVVKELTIADVYVRTAELPEGCRFAAGMPCASEHASAYYRAPSFKALMSGFDLPPEFEAEAEKRFPVPSKKEWQSFEADGGVPGSVLLFEYSPAEIEKVREFFPPYLYGEEGRSAEHPEEVIYGPRLVVVLSFPEGDPAAEWYKDRLRKKFKVPAVRAHLEDIALGVELLKALKGHDLEAGIALCEKNATQVESWAFAQFLLGVFRSASGDLEGAAKAYGRAVELHDTREDPLQETFVWAALDSLGNTLLEQGQAGAAIPVLQRAAGCGEEFGIEGVTRSCYALARACAREKRWAESLDALESAIDGDPDLAEEAAQEEDFAEARERSDFRDLLK